VVSVHLAPDSSYLPDASREKCLQALTCFVNSKWPGDDVFIVGDFNIYNVSDFRKKLMNTRFKTLLADDATTNLTRTKPYDHILVRNNERFATAEQAVVIDLKQVVETALASTSGTGSVNRKKELTELQDSVKDPKSQIFKQRLSDHCPIYCEYTEWLLNRTLVRK
jgi:predicted extracellular nuclease